MSEKTDSNDIPLATVLSGKNRKFYNFVQTLETGDTKAVHVDSDSDNDVPLCNIA